jgi:hypothetical protein
VRLLVLDVGLNCGGPVSRTVSERMGEVNGIALVDELSLEGGLNGAAAFAQGEEWEAVSVAEAAEDDLVAVG